MAEMGFDIHDYSLTDTIKGHDIISLTHSVDNWNLIGQFDAEIGPQTDGTYDMSQFPLGKTLDFQYLKKAVLMSYRPNQDVRYSLSGHDAGRLLDRVCPAPSGIPTGGANSVIVWLANQCGVTVTGTGGLTGIDARALITSDKVIDVIIELCQLSGILPYIGQDGSLNLVSPTIYNVDYPTNQILRDEGMELDLDNCAKGVCVVLYRRKKTDKEDDDSTPGGPYTEGQTPGAYPTTRTVTAGGVTYTYYDPLGIPIKVEGVSDDTITLEGGLNGAIRIATKSVENYDYDLDSSTYWDSPPNIAMANYQDNQEHRVYTWKMTDYSKTQEVSKYMSGTVNLSVKETTTETLHRDYDFDERLKSETYEKKTEVAAISGALPVLEGAPEYSAPFDEKYTTTYSRHMGGSIDFWDYLKIVTVRRTYEQEEIGSFPGVKKWDESSEQYVQDTWVYGDSGPLPLTVKGESFVAWVEHITTETVFEFMDSEGNVKIRVRSAIPDGGSTFRNAKGWLPAVKNDDSEEDAIVKRIQQYYEAFSEHGAVTDFEADVDGAPADETISTLDLPGMRMYYGSGGISDSEDWYNPATGGYTSYQGVCPHYSNGDCGIYDISVVWYYDERKCPNQYGRRWRNCPRAKGALEQANAENKNVQFEKPILCYAGNINSGMVYTRNVYIRDFITEAQAQTLGNEIAANLLILRGSRGWRRTITIPLDPSLHIDGTIVSIAHDYKEKTSTIKYRVDGDIPDFLNPNSIASLSYYVWNRENNRNTRTVFGEVIGINTSTKRITVQVGTDVIECSTNIVQVDIGDVVIVSLPAGNRMDGTIQERV
jgi:hypothetical protein